MLGRPTPSLRRTSAGPPVCGHTRRANRPSCKPLALAMGFMTACRFCQLDAEHLQFLEVFLRHRGMLAGVERELGISYPTARNKLDALLLALGIVPSTVQQENGQISAQQQEILDMLEQGLITAEEAARKLRNLR
ncbi:MAG: hypothetical protein C4337_10570 [Armatimonadota bacterium]